MSRHKAKSNRGRRLLHGMGVFFTYLLLWAGSVVVGWCFAYTIVYMDMWWLVPAVCIVLAPPTAFLTVKFLKWRRYARGSKAVIEKYTGPIDVIR